MFKDISRICNDFKTEPKKTLMIGDLPSFDGISASKAGTYYLQVPKPVHPTFTYTNFLE